MQPKTEITVTVRDSYNNSFSKSFLATADKRDAIRWTITHEDLPHHVDITKIVEVLVR